MNSRNQSQAFQTSARTADLLSRYLAALKSAQGRPVATEVMLDLLRFDTLDWKLDHGLIETEVVAPSPVPFRREA